MENYNIYDEIGRGTHSFVYKARRKRSIEYVAVKSTAKSRMDKILNEVPFLHKLDSPYVVKFFDWYESSNHIWLIMEYCMGGDLLNLITQDKQLPEAVVKSFGIELVAGLQYLHVNSILYCDLKPANILIDEFGSLKLADFGLARRIPTRDTAVARPLAPGSPHYMAPELFQQPAVHSFASDFWALGCVLYEIRTGRPPFTHTNFSELARMIQTEAVTLPVPGCEMSPAFCNLLTRLLTKDPYQRITWEELIGHPFWDEMSRVAIVPMPAQEIFDHASPTAIRKLNTSDNSSLTVGASDPDVQEENDGTDNNALSNGAATVIEQQPEENNLAEEDHDDDEYILDSDSEEMDGAPTSQRSINYKKLHNEVRPASAPTNNGNMLEATNDTETMDDIGSGLVGFEARQRWRIINAPRSAPPAVRQAQRNQVNLSNLFNRDGVPGNGLRKISKLIFTAADCRVKSIIGNKDLNIGDIPRVRAELLQFEIINPEGLLSCTTEALETQLKEIYVSLKSPHADFQEKLSVLAYLFSLSCHARLAHVIVNSSLLKLLIRLLAQEARLPESGNLTLPMLCLVLGVLFRFATFIAPSSPDQLQQLVMALLKIVRGRPNNFEDKRSIDTSGLQSRPLALACLGELLFYISTQQEWELPIEGVDCVLACMEDPDVTVRYYAVRTLGNMLINCADDLLPKLMSEQIILNLIRGLLQYTKKLNDPDSANKSIVYFALRTTTTEALAQVLRHFRTPSSVAKLTPRLKRTVMLYFAKPDVLNAVWNGVEYKLGSCDLAIASLNILNVFLEMKLEAGREAELAAIKASRTLLLERVVSIRVIERLLAIDSTASGDYFDLGNEWTVLRAKCLLLLHLGMQQNRSFLLAFIQNHGLIFVERVQVSIANRLSSDCENSSAFSPETQVPALEMYLAHCALNVCKLAIRMALKLGADCFSTPENVEDGRSNNNNVEHRPPRISPAPFELFRALIQNPTCRLQLLNYFEVNDSKQFTFFLRLMAKLLTTFPNEVLRISEGTEMTTTTTALYVSKILLEMFKFAVTEANDIVLVEKKVLFTHLLPAIAGHIYPSARSEDTRDDTVKTRQNVAVNCLLVLPVVLLDFDYGDDDGEDVLYDVFVRSHLIPQLTLVLNRPDAVIQEVWDSAIELLFNIISSDSWILNKAQELALVPTVMSLLRVSPKSTSSFSYASQLVKMLVYSDGVDNGLLYESGIGTSLVTGLEFAAKGRERDSSLPELLVILLQLLHEQYEKVRQSNASPTPPGLDELVKCGPLMVQLCATGDLEQDLHARPETLPSPEKGSHKPHRTTQTEEEIADLASRCLVFLSQIFGEKLNKVVFAQDKHHQPPVGNGVSRSFLGCLDRSDSQTDRIVMLRVLLTLKNCLRCQEDHSANVSRWIRANNRMLVVIRSLASKGQPGAETELSPSRQSILEQIAKTASAIARLCRPDGPPPRSSAR